MNKKWLLLCMVGALLFLGIPGFPQTDGNHYFRIARIVVDSMQLVQYNAALRLHMQTAMKKEPGVLQLWAVAEKKRPTHITVFEVYADMAAYRSHIQTDHFRRYKATVERMVLSLELVDVDPIGMESK